MMMTPNAPALPAAGLPLFPRLCLTLVASTHEVEDRMGDLEESYVNALASLGPEVALRRYRRDIASSILAIAYRRLESLILLRFLDRGRLLVSMVVAAGAFALCCGTLAALVPPPWWAQAGLPIYPGQFRGFNPPDYPVCQAWTDYQGNNRMARDLYRRGVHVLPIATQDAVRSGAGRNLSVLLPRTAKVVAIYCGTARQSAPIEECSRGGCDAGAAPFIEDSAYANGRVLTLGMATRSTAAEDHVTGHFWVAWQDTNPSP
ncbi:hypothetical protein [Nitrospirillum iridis]|uniref:Uncharacterized protein n=1 Tax=Nitrospirillum iridis TaxID=765888 RepID=A0A7X0B4E4_9PROT|nr:hypothetical protein [Nitrospirillum iridis]MBB6254771.1 hypothetical protein [Nitrospirillum iridis]